MNTEPADPEEREAQHLPPKSYADAAEEALSDHHRRGNNALSHDNQRTSKKTNGHAVAKKVVDTSVASHREDGSPSAAREFHKPFAGKSYADAAVEPPPPNQGSGDQHATTTVTSTTNGHSNDSEHHNSAARRTMNGRSTSQNQIIRDTVAANGDQLVTVNWELNKHREDDMGRPNILRSPSSKRDLHMGRQAGTGWENSAIRWAPLNVPLQRRLQTFMVLGHSLCIASFMSIFFLLCTIPILWPLLLTYLLWILFSRAGTDGTLYFRSETMRRLPIWSLFASYFPARLHRSQELPQTRKYIFGYHPHGIISHGAFAAFATEALGFSQLFPGITNTLLTLDANFRIPIYRDYALWLGLASVSRESCENLLSKGGPNNEGMGRAITIVVGGARESLDAQPNSMRLVLAKRKGFVKLAIRQGADLVPVLAFGENELYNQFEPATHPWIHKLQLLVKKSLGFTVPLFHARGVFNYDVGLMPWRRPINIVVGKPIMVQRQAKPDPNYVDELHAQYINELLGIWNEWKDQFAKDRQGELEIVE